MASTYSAVADDICLQARTYQMAVAAGDASVRVFDRRMLPSGTALLLVS